MSMYTIKSEETEVGWSCDSKKHRLNGTPPFKEMNDLSLPERKE